MTQMKVGIIGSGAMGTIFGLAMARSGHDVLFYDVRPDLIAAVEQDGLRLEGVLGTFHFRASATFTKLNFLVHRALRPAPGCII
jgi:2-dehydropantoate 2-reductase